MSGDALFAIHRQSQSQSQSLQPGSLESLTQPKRYTTVQGKLVLAYQ